MHGSFYCWSLYFFAILLVAAKTVSPFKQGINRMDSLGGKICMEMGEERPISRPRGYDLRMWSTVPYHEKVFYEELYIGKEEEGKKNSI